jgi:hypothetical protein
MTDPHHLNPGSLDAVHQGCRCSIRSNHEGRGADGRGTKFWVNPECPLHGVRSLAEGDDTAPALANTGGPWMDPQRTFHGRGWKRVQ